MVISFLQDRLAHLVLSHATEDPFRDSGLRPPMFLGNSAGHSQCLTGTAFQSHVLQHEVICMHDDGLMTMAALLAAVGLKISATEAAIYSRQCAVRHLSQSL